MKWINKLGRKFQIPHSQLIHGRECPATPSELLDVETCQGTRNKSGYDIKLRYII